MGMSEQKPKYRIRKLTPRECFSLQGIKEEYFRKAEAVVSSTQLQKICGNGECEEVVKAIFRQMLPEE